MFGLFITMNAQITGRVLSADGIPIDNALVIGNNIRTQTDNEGFFTIDSGAQLTLQIVAEGYQNYFINGAFEKGDSLQIELQKPSYVLPEITISSNGNRQSSAIYSPIPVQQVSSDYLRQYSSSSLMKTIARVPGIDAMGIGASQSKPVIRGLGFNRLVVIENGIKHEGQQWGADHGLEIDQFAVKSVDIIKGASALGYGSEAIAGALLLSHDTIPINNGINAEVNMMAQTNNQLLGTSIQMGLRQKNLYFSLRGTLMDYGDYRVPVDSIPMYSFWVPLHRKQVRNTAGKERNIHGAVGYIGSRVTSIFYLSHLWNKTGFFANAHGLEPRRINQAEHDKSNRDILYPSSNVNHFKLINHSEVSFVNVKIESLLGYQHNFRQEHSQYIKHGYMPNEFPSNMGFSSDLERQFDKHTWSANLKTKYWLRPAWLLVGGNQFEFQQNTIDGRGFIIPSYNKWTNGLYMTTMYQQSAKHILQGGIRYDVGYIDTKAYVDWYNSPKNENSPIAEWEPIQRASSIQRFFHHLSWSFGYRYAINQWDLAWNIGNGFRMPEAKELAANGVNYHRFSYEKGNELLQPENVYQLDLALSYKQNKWNYVISPFVSYFSNYIYLNPTPYHDWLYGNGNQVFNYEQAAVFRTGGELEASYRFIDDWRFDVGAELVVSQQLTGNKKGYTLPFSPPHSFSTSLHYEPQKNIFLGKPFFSIDSQFVAQQSNLVPPEEFTPGYILLGMQMGSRFDLANMGILANIQINNILNTKYYSHTSYYRLLNIPEQGINITANIIFSL